MPALREIMKMDVRQLAHSAGQGLAHQKLNEQRTRPHSTVLEDKF